MCRSITVLGKPKIQLLFDKSIESRPSPPLFMTEDDLVAKYAAEALASMKMEAEKRIEEVVDVELENRLRKTSLFTLLGGEEIIPALLSRLNEVRAALDGHGGGIKLTSYSIVGVKQKTLDIVLDLTGACLSCGAAPGTLEGVKNDLESDIEISSVKFSSDLLDTFDELGREFILAHGKVEFV